MKNSTRVDAVIAVLASFVFFWIVLGIIVSPGRNLHNEDTVSKEEYASLQKQYTDLQNQHDILQAKYDNLQIRYDARENQHSISELYKMSRSMNFEEVLAAVEYPDAPAELLYSIARDMPATTSEEVTRLTIALLSAKNTNASVLSALTNTIDIDSVGILASSDLNDENSLYLLATNIADIYQQTPYTFTKNALYYAAVECVRNPAVTPETLNKLKTIPNEDLATIVQAKLDSMS